MKFHSKFRFFQHLSKTQKIRMIITAIMVNMKGREYPMSWVSPSSKFTHLLPFIIRGLWQEVQFSWLSSQVEHPI